MYRIGNHLLYIGLNGYAGAGKDTVAKMLSVIFNNLDNQNSEELYKVWFNLQKNTRYATFARKDEIGNTMCLAFADKLKKIASEIFAIPIEHFYNNKTSGWINISGNFEYTEQKPLADEIVSAEDYASGGPQYYQNSLTKYWMSIREILVYVGTYILQKEVNQNVFINITENRIKNHCRECEGLEYVICTDVRFSHEADYIREKNGILINIVRSDIIQLNNVAEHDLDEENDYDFIIENDGNYEDLWNQVWNLVHSNSIFLNRTVQLMSHDGSDNFLRLVDIEDNKETYRLCMEFASTRVQHTEDGSLMMVDPSGGPALYLGKDVHLGKGISGTITKIFTKTEPFGFYIEIEK